MSATVGLDTRDVVPRWRDVTRTLVAGELPTRQPVGASGDELELLELRAAEWREHGTETYAIEFVGTALMLQRLDLAAEALAFLSADTPSRWASIVQDSRERRSHEEEASVLTPESDPPRRSEVAVRIAELRSRLRQDPRRALGWSELGRCYTALGLTKQAERALTVALSLSPGSRYLLRNAACFYIHTDRPDRAHSLLTRTDATPTDPWLVATELAAAHVAGAIPKYVKRGRLMVEDDNFSNFQLTELASELATLELSSGVKRARRLFDKALLDPNDNSLAQAEWASHRASGITVSSEQLAELPATEARSLHALHEGRWDEAWKNATNWQNDQFFSSKAAMVASYSAAVGLMMWQESFDAAKIGLRIHPEDAGLLNNAAYALVEMGQYDRAAKYLDLIAEPHATDNPPITSMATKGLLAFRTGDIELGRQRYATAIRLARRLSDAPTEAMANVMLAREEVRIGSDLWQGPLAEAARLAGTVKSPGTESWISRVEGMLAGASHARMA